MQLSVEPDIDFQLTPSLIEAVEAQFGFSLLEQDIALLERHTRITIQARRKEHGRKAREAIRRAYSAMTKRRMAIVQVVDDLAALLEDDDSAPEVWRLNVGTHALMPSVCNDVAPTLQFLRGLASKPYPVNLGGNGPEPRRRWSPDRDGWDHLILVTILIFHWHGKPFTANGNAKRGYDSPLLRGLGIIHDALPRDVQAKSSAALGSPAYGWIRKARRRKKDGETFVHRGEWPVR